MENTLSKANSEDFQPNALLCTVTVLYSMMWARHAYTHEWIHDSALIVNLGSVFPDKALGIWDSTVSSTSP